MNKSKSFDTQKLVLLALLTAIVAILQMIAVILPIFPFTLTLVLIPIVIGAALINTFAGCWLGLVFGLAVLLSGNANVFLAVNPAATIFVVLLKGMLSGFAAGAVYKLLAGKNKTVATVAAAIVSPIVNTGIFVLGCYVFFMPVVMGFIDIFGLKNANAVIFLGFVGMNFPLELGFNIVLSPTIVRLVQYGQDRRIK